MRWIHLVLLGVIQGLTEFLPHFQRWPSGDRQLLLGISEDNLAITVALHSGTLLAVMVYFRKDLLQIARALPAMAKGGAVGERRLLVAIVAGSVPTAVIGIALKGPTQTLSSNLWAIGAFLLLSGAWNWVVVRKSATPGETRGTDTLKVGDALAIGVVQGLAVMPGLSRSDSTIGMGTALGLSREAAARYSFLLSLPGCRGRYCCSRRRTSPLPHGRARTGRARERGQFRRRHRGAGDPLPRAPEGPLRRLRLLLLGARERGVLRRVHHLAIGNSPHIRVRRRGRAGAAACGFRHEAGSAARNNPAKCGEREPARRLLCHHPGSGCLQREASVVELLVFKGDREVERYMLGAGATTLGRSDDCNLLLDDSAVSRQHARLRVESGRVFLADLGSGNGTWFQGLRVRDMELTDGAEFKIEPFTLRVAISQTNRNVVAAATRPVERSSPELEPAALQEPSASESRPRTPGGSAALGPRLERVRGGDGPILLGRDETVLGRGDDVSIPLRDASASRRHARLTWNGASFAIEDLNSANGTWVNGERLAGRRTLKDGDRVHLGDTELLFADPAASTVSAVDLPIVPTKPIALESDEEPVRNFPLAEASRAARTATPPRPTPRHKPAPLPEPEPPEHTEAGPPPPSAFESFEETDPGGPAMELSAIVRATPDADVSRRRKLLAGAGIGLALFLALVMLRPTGPRADEPEPEPDRMQSTMLLTMERLSTEAEQALSAEPKNFALALDRYGRIAAQGRNPELQRFRRARDLQRTASEMVGRVHEAMLARALRDETLRRAEGDAATQKKIATAIAAAKDAIAAGRRGSLDAFDRALRSLADVLALSPGHPEAARLLADVRPERDALAQRFAAASRERIERDCKALHAKAAAKHAPGRWEGLQAAIALYDQIARKDESGVTTWRDRARADRARALAALGGIVSPLRESARRALASQDPRGARTFLRKAAKMNPYDPQIDAELANAQAECERTATHHLQLAKAYNEARNYAEAKKECELVMTYADRPEDKLWQQADEIKRSIQRTLQN